MAEAATSTGSALTAAAGAAGGGRLAEALGAFEHELSARSDLLGDVVRAAATALERTAQDYQNADSTAADALRPGPGLEGSMFGGVLG